MLRTRIRTNLSRRLGMAAGILALAPGCSSPSGGGSGGSATATSPGATAEFGMGPTSGPVMLHYSGGKLVSDTLPVPAPLEGMAVGALGGLFYS